LLRAERRYCVPGQNHIYFEPNEISCKFRPWIGFALILSKLKDDVFVFYITQVAQALTEAF
jgi:hypothetical protein